jgi:hypothetical protein
MTVPGVTGVSKRRVETLDLADTAGRRGKHRGDGNRI